jgi:hypothetical protein
MALFAADVWKDKNPSAWTPEDLQKILTDSPWAKTVAVKREGSRRGGAAGPGGGTWGGGGGGVGGGIEMPRIGGLGIPGGGMGGGRRGGGRQPQESFDVIVRWNSAEPVRLALLKAEMPSGQKDDEKAPDPAAKSYIISVTGLPAGAHRSNHDDDVEPSRREELMESAHLTLKGRRTLVPNDVKFDVQGSRREILFYFTRENKIDQSGKEATFVIQRDRLKLEKKFNLKEMVFQGKLAL